MLLEIALIVLIAVILSGAWIFYDLYKRAKKRYWDIYQKLTDVQQQILQVQQEIAKVQQLEAKGQVQKNLGNRKIDGPIIVYQMAKVGSRSVYDTLAKLNLGVPVYHRHVLNDLDKMAEDTLKQLDNPAATLREIEEGKKLRRLIDEDPQQRWYLISLVRDPIARTVSQFFQSIEYEEIITDARRKISDGSIGVDDLFDVFLNKWPRHYSALVWFDLQLKPVFDIDVYSKPFPWEKGFDIFRNGRFSLLLMRLEDLNVCAADALSKFLGLQGVKLIKSNEASNKWYQGIYQEFISKIVLPEKYLDEIYNSKFSRHFYSPKELEAFRAKWTQRLK